MKVSGINPTVDTQQVQHREKHQESAGVPVVDEIAARAQGKESQESKERNISKEELDQAVEQVNQTMQVYKTSIRFKVHEESGEYYAQVVNADTEEVIREVPPEWVLDFVAQVRKMVGLIVDELV